MSFCFAVSAHLIRTWLMTEQVRRVLAAERSRNAFQSVHSQPRNWNSGVLFS